MITQEELNALAKKYGGISIEISEVPAEEIKVDPITSFSSIFRLNKNAYAVMEDTKIVITEEDDQCVIGVTAIGRFPDGRVCQFGDLMHVSKNETIGNFFQKLGEVMQNTSDFIKENTSVEA